MVKGLSRPSILAITSDRAFLREIRLEMPLLNLKRQQLIDDYFITNHILFDVPDEFSFDVLWLQRISDPRLMDHLLDRIGNNFLYDLDDLLIGSPSYIPATDMLHKEVITRGIENCTVLSVTSNRLATLVQKFVKPTIIDKIAVCPNAYEFSGKPRIPIKPTGLIVTQSDRLALTSSRDSVLGAVVDFCKKYGLPVYCFGSCVEDQLLKSENLIRYGNVSFWHYHAILAALPSMIGIAPLETNADPNTLDFVNGKSDVKMLEFGGFGHPSVYSKAPPYTDTDLKAGILVENSYEEWFDGLEAIYRDLWKQATVDQEHVIRLRTMKKIAVACWCEAIERSRLSSPMKGKDIKFPGGVTRFYVDAARHLLAAQDNHFRQQVLKQTSPLLLRLLKRIISAQ